MRVIAQNVISASVKVNNNCIGQIDRGLLLFVGFCAGDNEDIAQKLAEKIVHERVFMDENRRTNRALKDINGSILSISQFTLYADLNKGLRPSFGRALEPRRAKELYLYFNNCLEKLVSHPIACGEFGADMAVELCNDGPFTIVYDSKELFDL